MQLGSAGLPLQPAASKPPLSTPWAGSGFYPGTGWHLSLPLCELLGSKGAPGTVTNPASVLITWAWKPLPAKPSFQKEPPENFPEGSPPRELLGVREEPGRAGQGRAGQDRAGVWAGAREPCCLPCTSPRGPGSRVGACGGRSPGCLEGASSFPPQMRSRMLRPVPEFLQEPAVTNSPRACGSNPPQQLLLRDSEGPQYPEAGGRSYFSFPETEEGGVQGPASVPRESARVCPKAEGADWHLPGPGSSSRELSFSGAPRWPSPIPTKPPPHAQPREAPWMSLDRGRMGETPAATAVMSSGRCGLHS